MRSHTGGGFGTVSGALAAFCPPTAVWRRTPRLKYLFQWAGYSQPAAGALKTEGERKFKERLLCPRWELPDCLLVPEHTVLRRILRSVFEAENASRGVRVRRGLVVEASGDIVQSEGEIERQTPNQPRRGLSSNYVFGKQRAFTRSPH